MKKITSIGLCILMAVVLTFGAPSILITQFLVHLDTFVA